ncbi:MAG: hypothetical protein Q8P59_13200, partial [Dehalococcoidia bacterium]|nr:hypothetical protein [Dehalococcoidia bacterium]
NVLYAGAGYQGLSSAIYKTQDGGESWIPLTVGLSDALVSSIAVDPGNPNRVFAGTRGQGVFSSTDGGQTWQPVGQGVLETQIAAVAIDNLSSIIYAAGMRQGFYRSADGGRTWEQVGGGIGDRAPTALALDPHSSHTLWLVSTGGVYKSSDGGSQWLEAGTGVAASQVVDVALHPSDPTTLFVSAWAGGVYKTNDGGASWQAVPLGVGIASSLAVDPGDPNLVYAGMIYLAGNRETGLYLSRDAGSTWQAVLQFRDVPVVAVATAPRKVYVGTEVGVFYSEDSGSTWKQSESGLPSSSRQVSVLTLHPRDPSRLYLTLQVATQDLYWSKDGGQTWGLLHSFPQPLSLLAPSPAATGLLYAATDVSILRSSDWGESWKEYPFSAEGTIIAVAPHPLAPDTLYLGTTKGVYRSLDGGATWSFLGLDGEAVQALAISRASPTQLYAGTLGSGLWAYTAVPSLRVQPSRLAFLA